MANIGKIDAYSKIYNMIITGVLPMGSAISEVDIANKLEISRSPVREALRKLETQGIVTHHNGRGTFVRQITPQDIRELYDLRSILERSAVETAIDNIMPVRVDELIERFTALNMQSPVEEYHKANQELHYMIVNGSGNSHLVRFYEMLNAEIAVLNSISAQEPQNFVESRKQHLDILYAIKEKDVERAKQCIAVHAEHIRENTVRYLLNELR